MGFIGLGVMGLPMAANLASRYPSLVVWNRSPKTDALIDLAPQADIATADTPADVVAKADVTFSMLATPEAVEQVFFEGNDAALMGVSEGKVVVDCSTLQVEDMKKTSQEVKKRGGAFLEAPVSGSLGPAKQGSLIFLCGGDKAVFDNDVVKEGLDVMGKKSFYLGDVGKGTEMKVRCK